MPVEPTPPALIGGPYKLPRNAHIGTVHECESRGEILVSGFMDAPIPWIFGRPLEGLGAPSVVLCGDLARAIRTESVAAVAYWFGVSRQTVSAWRRSLGVGPITPGTAAVIKHPPPPTAKQARERGRKGGAAGKGTPKPRRG